MMGVSGNMENLGDDDTTKKSCDYCFTSIEDCINSRRCFMTGEYCSKQTNIQKERKRLHKDNAINAFVVMNFSNMSDVVYKWKLKSFIESLSKYLYIDLSKKRIYCQPLSKLSDEDIQKEGWKPIEKIKVIRADSNPASNYVICNRVCQQLQIADLVIVDVSMENSNVFYEFGMAVALGKMILPICYSESFYEMSVPKGAAKIIKAQKAFYLEHHIGCYPWRKRLFEYYGIRYRSDKDSALIKKYKDNDADFDINRSDRGNELPITRYMEFNEAVKKEYEFEDMQYDRFPYHEVIDEMGTHGESNKKRIGEKIYNRLKETYNQSEYKHNTLVVYTMDGFLNEAQAGRCIINFYNNITKQMKEVHCFCGDRVGVLIQGNSIPEDVRDAKTEKKLLYSVGEIIHIGMNQATYTALKEKIKTKFFLKTGKKNEDKEDEVWQRDIKRFTKEHIWNKSISIYPNNPVYVNRVKNGLQSDILENDGNKDFAYDYYFCLYHVMLRTLKYTNELVVDISKNCLQSLFWLGAAHASDIYAITVQHEESERERAIMDGASNKKEREIFDVAGLWTAILRSYDTEGFYTQLELAQQGIEQHTKLMLKNVGLYEDVLKKHLYDTRHISSEEAAQNIKELLMNKEKEETHVLESYYRDRFWKPMLRYNRLWIYLPQIDDKNPGDGDPKLHAAKWDVDAIAALSHYLSKRKVIGEYNFKTLGKNVADDKAGSVNFICVGDDARPLKKPQNNLNNAPTREETESLAQYISNKIGMWDTDISEENNDIHYRSELSDQYSCKECPQEQKRIYKGFSSFSGKPERNIYTQLPKPACYDCIAAKAKNQKEDQQNVRLRIENTTEKIFYGSDNFADKECNIDDTTHYQLAQLLLWRDISQNDNDRVYFRVSLTGVSGPATLALAAVLVDDDQKKEIFNIDEKSAPDGWDKLVEFNPLNELQEQIRGQFWKKYSESLKEKLKSLSEKFWENSRDEQVNIYVARVKYAAGMYLSTVLYCYLLPFLSMDDEYRICNGMQIFVSSMMAADISPFSLNYLPDMSAPAKFVKEAAKAVTATLEKVLHSFRGVEALYEVEVMIDKKENDFDDLEGAEQEENNQNGMYSDTRRVVGIKKLSGSSCSAVNCLFITTDCETSSQS